VRRRRSGMLFWVVTDDEDDGATEQARVVVVVRGWSAGEVVREGDGCRGRWRLQLWHEDGRREGKLWLGFWLWEGERVMRCHFMIGYF